MTLFLLMLDLFLALTILRTQLSLFSTFCCLCCCCFLFLFSFWDSYVLATATGASFSINHLNTKQLWEVTCLINRNGYIITSYLLSSLLESRIDFLWIFLICIFAGGTLLIFILLCCISAMGCWLCVRCCSQSKKSKCKSVNFTDERAQHSWSNPSLNMFLKK